MTDIRYYMLQDEEGNVAYICENLDWLMCLANHYGDFKYPIPHWRKLKRMLKTKTHINLYHNGGTIWTITTIVTNEWGVH